MIKKIFWVVLVITLLAWVGVGIYYFKSTPSVPLPAKAPPPTKSQEKVELILGTIASLDQDKFTLVTEGGNRKIVLSSEVSFYKSTKAGCDIEINPNCGVEISESTREEVLKEGAPVTVACKRTNQGLLAIRVNLVSSP